MSRRGPGRGRIEDLRKSLAACEAGPLLHRLWIGQVVTGPLRSSEKAARRQWVRLRGEHNPGPTEIRQMQRQPQGAFNPASTCQSRKVIRDEQNAPVGVLHSLKVQLPLARSPCTLDGALS